MLSLILVALLSASTSETPPSSGAYVVMGRNSFSDALWLLDPDSVVRNGDRVTFSRATVFAPRASTRNGREVAYVTSRAVIDCAARTEAWGDSEFHDDKGAVWDRFSDAGFRRFGGGGAQEIHDALCLDHWPAESARLTEAQFMTDGRAMLTSTP